MLVRTAAAGRTGRRDDGGTGGMALKVAQSGREAAGLRRALLRQGRLTRAGIAGLAALVLVLGAAGTAAALTTQSSRLPLASHLRLPVAYNGVDGWSGGRVRLAVLYVGGPDTFVRTARWARWSGTSAVSHGTLWVDDCRPNCAAGHYHRYPATVTLSRVAHREGVSFFSRMRLRYVHGRQRDYRFRWGTYQGATAPLWIGGPG